MMGVPKIKDQLKFQIEVTSGPHKGLQLNFSKEIVTIGRGPENDIILANDPKTSRQHAEIRQRDSDFVIVNLSQKNFILVNGQNVQTEIIANGAQIKIGETEILFKQETSAVVLASVPKISVTPTSPIVPLRPLNSAPSVSSPNSTAHYRPNSVPSMQPPPMTNPGAGYSANTNLQHSSSPLQNPKVRFYGIIAVIGLLGWFFFSSNSAKNKKDLNAIRTSAISMQDVANAEKRTQELLNLKKEKYDSVQYRRAQENFLKGFRDFKQGQYARAREAFQVVLNLDPSNELAQRYLHLSKIKFDELVKFNMIQGNRYREKKSWRMCQSNYSNVMTMLQNRKEDPSFKEAKQYYEECTLNLEGRY